MNNPGIPNYHRHYSTKPDSVANLWRPGHQRCCDREEDFIAGVLVCDLLDPQQLKHGLNGVSDKVLVILNMAL